MNTPVLSTLLMLCTLAGAAAGAFIAAGLSRRKVRECERLREEQERRRAELAAQLHGELSKIRNGLADISAAYEDVVGVMEREFGESHDLHLRLEAPERPALAIEHKGSASEAEPEECEVAVPLQPIQDSGDEKPAESDGAGEDETRS